MNEKQIKESATEMVKEALFRKPLKTLKKLEKETKEKKKSGLRTRMGCVSLQIGDEEVLL